MKKKLVGRYIVTDPKVCHGEPTFRGTRILVADVLEQVANGVAWESIVEEWRGSVTREAIAESGSFRPPGSAAPGFQLPVQTLGAGHSGYA